MSLLALLLVLQSVPGEAAVIDDSGLITVTATRLDDLAAAARRCETQACPTREDVAVSVAYASALFDAGDYREAKRLLAAAVDRNRAAARAEPLAVSQLFSAQATLSAHEGDQNTTRKAIWASRNVLTAVPTVPVLPRLTAEFRLADWQLRTGDRAGAERRFAAIATEAGASGNGAIGDVANLRRALTLQALGQRRESRALLEKMAARTDEGSGDVQRAALAMAARLAFLADDKAAADGFAARLAGIAAGPDPLLVSAPPLPRPGGPKPDDGGSLIGMDRGARGSALTGLKWVDIGFWIKPDGSVDDVAILRGSRATDWAAPLLGYIGGRRYSAFAPGGSDRGGRYRVERYTLTADYGTPIGSLVRRRSVNQRFEMMEMSADAPE